MLRKLRDLNIGFRVKLMDNIAKHMKTTFLYICIYMYKYIYEYIYTIFYLEQYIPFLLIISEPFSRILETLYIYIIVKTYDNNVYI